MSFNDGFKDWAGNNQTVLSWMNHVDEKLAGLHAAFFAPGAEPSRIPGDKNRTNLRDAIMDTASWSNQTLGSSKKSEFELTYRHPNRVDGKTTDTMLGYTVNADAYGLKLTNRVDELEKKLDLILAKLGAEPPKA